VQQRKAWGEAVSIPKEHWFKKFQFLANDHKKHMVLESGRSGRYSMIGLDPIASLKGKNNMLTIEKNGETMVIEGNPLHAMRDWLAQYHIETNSELPPFQGGAIGYISYDYVRYIEKLPELAADDLNLPELHFFVFQDVFVYDHSTEQLWVIVTDEKENITQAQLRLSHYMNMWIEAPIQPISYGNNYFMEERKQDTFSMDEEKFSKAVHDIHEYISSGDVFQVNIAVRQTRQLKSHPMEVYEQLRLLNPSPYMSYLQFEDFQIVSASPELLVKKRKNEVSTRPIAGTRSRGRTAEEDEQLAEELLSNEKERAEHIMLVDLERNDLGRVCKYGTVEVDELMTIERYSHVMHIVSNVKGQLAEGNEWTDVVDATFPGGTITGAPKVRTMEIIEEIEPVRRGVYTGSIGWIGFDENMELNIAIRSMVVKDGQAHVQAGAGIVIDSHPQYEYKESLKKAEALWRAKELSEYELSGGSRV
jgi:para-aminobenzoate synthetase component 1